MSLIRVKYRLKVGKKTFKKELRVFSLPSVGSLLRAANNSFIVTEHEQDLDNYGIFEDEETLDHIGPFEFIVAIPNPKMYNSTDYETIVKDLLDQKWKIQ